MNEGCPLYATILEWVTGYKPEGLEGRQYLVIPILRG